MSLADELIAGIQGRFRDREFATDLTGNPCAVFPSPSAEVGSIEIHDDGHELTVYLGHFTHVHFDNFDRPKSDSECNRAIVSEVLDFLEEVFNDDIEFFGTPGGSGGWHYRKDGPRGFLSKLFFGQKEI
jgi:hypothetical protein